MSLHRRLLPLTLALLLTAPSAMADDTCVQTPPGPLDWLRDLLGGGDSGGEGGDDGAVPDPEPEDPTDTDGDGVPDVRDAFPNNHHESVDTDGDGVGDEADAFPEDPDETLDSDCDGVGDNADEEFDGEVETEVDYPWSDGVYGWHSKFDLTTTGEGEMTATVKVYLDGDEVSDEKLEEWTTATEEMWSNDNLTVELEFVDDEDDAHSTVQVSEGSGRANAGHFYTEDDGTTAAHEIGHHMGLFDEYVDGNDPDRVIGEDDSIMRVVWDDPTSYPRHQAFIMSLFDCP